MKKFFAIVCAVLLTGFSVGKVNSEDVPDKSFQFQMNGNWLPDVHPLHVGANNYTEVKNLSPTQSGYETVEGYSKINTTATASPVQVHQFKKENETHVIAKVNSSGTYYLYDNTTAIPSQGDFGASPLHTVGSSIGSFANGPQGTMFYADGQYSLVTGGDEMRVALFFIGDSLDSLQDFSENVSNDLTDKYANLGSGGNDSSTVLLLHMDGSDASTTFTDSGATTHVMTATGDAQIDIDYYKFGGASGIFDGVGDYLSTGDHADYNYGTGLVTIDDWVMFSSTSGQQMLYFQGAATTYVSVFQDFDNSKIRFIVESAGTQLIHLSGAWSPTANILYHWAVVRGWGGNANDWAITINGTAVATATASITMPNVAASLLIGTASNTVLIDIGNTGHGFTMANNATLTYGSGKFGTGGFDLDGTGDYASTADSSDWDILTQTNATVKLWVKHTDHVGLEHYVDHYEDVNNRWGFFHEDGAGIRFNVYSGGVQVLNLVGGEITDTSKHEIVLSKVGSEYGIYKDGVQVAYTNDSSTDDFAGTLWIGTRGGTDEFSGTLDEIEITHSNLFGAAPDAGLTDTISVTTDHQTTINSSTKLLLYCDVPNLNGSLDEYRISKGVARWTANFTPYSSAYYDQTAYFYVLSPLKLNGIKLYIGTANDTASTLTGAVSVGNAWSTLNITDNTSAGGISLAQTGTIMFSYNEDAKPIYVNETVLYAYRFAVSAGGATAYKATASAPLQPIRDVWDRSPRTCISFQALRSGVYEDYTFLVEGKDSSTGSPYAATIGGLVASDSVVVLFDDRTMGINFTMLSNLVNAANAQVDDISYWDGTQYVSVGSFTDKTLDTAGDSSFAQSGVIWWNPPSSGIEQSRTIFGVNGYAYKIDIDGTLTDGSGHNGTSIDLVTGITAPLEMVGYDRVGVYNGRVMLIDGNRVDYSQTDTPWVFNGVDSSDGGRLSLYFGGENDITATGRIYNRFGSTLVEAWVVTKDNSTFILTGSHPYIQYDNAFTIKTVSENIGCHAPMTMVSSVSDIGDGLNMSILAWLDYSGPIIFNGAEPVKLTGVENYFDQASTEYINYSYLDQSVAYIDTINNQINFLFPTGENSANSKWIAYDIKYKKWFEKVPPKYLVNATAVADTNGARYNYGFLSSGHMMRLDNSSTWDSTAIAQNIKTGYFSPPIEDDFGFWTRSEIRAIRLLSADISEDQDVTATIYNDGSLSSNSLTIALNVSGAISKNIVGSGNLSEQADFYQVNFAASNSTDKWKPLAWGYKARKMRTD